MKKKYFFMLILTLFLSLSFMVNIEARKQYYCKYTSSQYDISATFTLGIKNSKTNASKVLLSGSDLDKNLWFKTNSESVKNWSENFFEKVNFTGANYYDKNTSCPPYLLISNSNTGYNVFVSDKDSLSSIKTSIKDKYSTLKDGFPKVLDVVGVVEEVEVEEPSSCLDFNQKGNSSAEKGSIEYYSCENNPYFACVWNESEYGGYCNVDKLQYVSCGDAFDIPREAPEIISFLVNLLKIGTPIILIVVSIITLLKAMSAQKEDEIKKAQSSLIRKIIAAAMVFFVISIVQFVIMKVADNTVRSSINNEYETTNISTCLSCFLNNDCSDNIYYKTNVGGTDICTYLDGRDATDMCNK